MAFVPSFSTTQIRGNSSQFVATDTSQDNDVAIVGRRLYVKICDGTFLVEKGITTEYNTWNLANVSQSFDVLSKDYGTLLTCEWVDVNGDVLYSAQQYAGFTLWNETFMYMLIQMLSGNPVNMEDNNFFGTMSELRDCIDSGNQAIEFFIDLYAVQRCYDRGTNIRINSPYFFNANS